MTTATATAVTVPGKAALVGMLADLALSTDGDPIMPDFLGRIHLHTEGGRLHGWTTDRFRAAHASVDCNGDLPPVEIDAGDAAALLRKFRTEPAVQIRTAGDDRIEFSSPASGAALTVSAWEPDKFWPQAQRIASGDLPEANLPVTFNPAYLADYAKIAKRRKETVAICGADKRKPAHVGIGPDYRAWQMPVFGDTGPDWLAPTYAPDIEPGEESCHE